MPHKALRIAAAAMVLWLAPAGGRAAEIFIMTSNTDHAYFAKVIGGDLVEIYCPYKGYMEPELTWADQVLASWVIKARRADLYIRYGLNADIWAETLIEASRNPKIAPGAPGNLDPSEGIPLLEVPAGGVDRRMGEIHLWGNPHYLLDPANAIPVAKAIARRMEEIWPQHAQVFQRNLEGFLATLQAKMAEWDRRAEPLRGKSIAEYHRTWSYFAHRYGLNVVGVVEPKPGIEPTVSDVETLIQAMKANQTSVLIKAPVYADKWPNYVATHLGYPVKVYTLGAHVGGDKGVDTYFDLFDYLIDHLLAAYDLH